MLFHGPIPQKFDVLYIKGDIAVWAFYSARLLVGFLVGITCWPERWYVRGPLCGFLALLPPAIITIATPGCGTSCMRWNLTTGTLVGLLVAGCAYWITGRHHLYSEPRERVHEYGG
jgi:hypothetical protein